MFPHYTYLLFLIEWEGGSGNFPHLGKFSPWALTPMTLASTASLETSHAV